MCTYFAFYGSSISYRSVYTIRTVASDLSIISWTRTEMIVSMRTSFNKMQIIVIQIYVVMHATRLDTKSETCDCSTE